METDYHTHLFAVDVFGEVDVPANRWLSREEVEGLRTLTGEPVSEQVRKVFALSGVTLGTGCDSPAVAAQT